MTARENGQTFETNPATVLDVLRVRAAELAAQGDRTLSLELERAMWLVGAHEERAKNDALSKEMKKLERAASKSE